MTTLRSVLFAIAAVAWSCDRPSTPASFPPSTARGAEDLGPGDVLDIRVREQEDLTGPSQVGDDGKIRFPWIGSVEVEGRQPDEIAIEIETRLADG